MPIDGVVNVFELANNKVPPAGLSYQFAVAPEEGTADKVTVPGPQQAPLVTVAEAVGFVVNENAADVLGQPFWVTV